MSKLTLLDLFTNFNVRKPGSRDIGLAVFRVSDHGYGQGRLFLGVNYNAQLEKWIMHNGTTLEYEDSDVLLWCRVESFINFVANETRSKATATRQPEPEASPRKLASFESNGVLKSAISSASNKSLMGGTGTEIIKLLNAEVPKLVDKPKAKPKEEIKLVEPQKPKEEVKTVTPAAKVEVAAPVPVPAATTAPVPEPIPETVTVVSRGVPLRDRMLDFLCACCESVMEGPVKIARTIKNDKGTTYEITCPVCSATVPGELRALQPKKAE